MCCNTSAVESIYEQRKVKIIFFYDLWFSSQTFSYIISIWNWKLREFVFSICINIVSFSYADKWVGTYKISHIKVIFHRTYFSQNVTVLCKLNLSNLRTQSDFLFSLMWSEKFSLSWKIWMTCNRRNIGLLQEW